MEACPPTTCLALHRAPLCCHGLRATGGHASSQIWPRHPLASAVADAHRVTARLTLPPPFLLTTPRACSGDGEEDEGRRGAAARVSISDRPDFLDGCNSVSKDPV
ncbi:hypothetical protein E2562_010329 [Oryza meyeriana var. granulata]|uniref:Uncharacterized protein n=1 Tax=Oryza meyeriana var. granulata TaxID=110450 RepID=A0A6G1CUN7_9ORYZ|nr:hypothetical protein E2562_029896 [Oryza meyeriana var. granulata]KAF0932414.1 hypothetical protein E2562_010329 [Oryza meyeriana var. granulata]